MKPLNQTINRCIRNMLSILLIILFLVVGVATSPKEDVRRREHERWDKEREESQRYIQKLKEEHEKNLLEEQKNSQNDESDSTDENTELNSMGENYETIESNN